VKPSANIRSEIEATRALLKFYRDHEGGEPTVLLECLEGLESGDIDRAVAATLRVKPHGMGGLTDWYPPVTQPNESDDYLEVVLHALVDHWWTRMSWYFRDSE